jgi:hypothetical protein
MSGQFKPVAFEPYGSRRVRWRFPRWLALLLGGIAIGAGGVIVIQERYLPPRLSVDESSKLRSAFDQADAERLRLKGELGETAKRLETTLSSMKGLNDELAASRANAERLREDVTSAIASLPPDPRGGAVEVRSGRFSSRRGVLAYDVVLTRERASSKPMAGVMQLVVAGESARGSETTVTLKPVDLSIGSHEIVRGSQALPDGFRPRQVTIQVLDRAAGRSLGMRVMLIS